MLKSEENEYENVKKSLKYSFFSDFIWLVLKKCLSLHHQNIKINKL